MGKRAIDHDKYVGIMKSLAQAEELQEKDKLKSENKYVEKQKNCKTCNKGRNCKIISNKTSYSGVYSIGGEEDNEKKDICQQWVQKKDDLSDPKQIKNLMKQFRIR